LFLLETFYCINIDFVFYILYIQLVTLFLYRFRMDKMEAQIANLAAWVQSAVVSTGSSRASSVKSGVSTTPSDTGGSQPGSVCSKYSVTVVRGDNSISSSVKSGMSTTLWDGGMTARKCV